METGNRLGTQAREQAVASSAEQRVDGYLMADFPWYGLDQTYRGRRWLMQVGTTCDGTVEHGSLGHGDEPSKNLGVQESRRFVVVVTVPHRPVRQAGDGTGVLEATSVSTAAWLAGAGLLACTWPSQMDRSLRQKWLEQQTAIAWDLADAVGEAGWSRLTLPVDGVATTFHYRESEYGWVLAGETGGVCVGAYGRGMSAYSLGFGVVTNIAAYCV